MVCPWSSLDKNGNPPMASHPSPENIPDPGIKPGSPALQAIFFLPSELPGKPNLIFSFILRINFPLEIKSLPRESMLTIKLFGITYATNADLLAWTCFPLFPKQ